MFSGAEKLSVYFGDILQEDFGLEDHRGDAELDKVWAQKIVAYYEEKAAQEAELAEYGYLKSLTME